MENLTNIPIPASLRHLKLWHGFPITYVTQMNGDQPDFRTINILRVRRCMKHGLCGICGEEIKGLFHFIGGNRSAESGHFSDPPMHSECAYYSAQVCPYLMGTKRQFGAGPSKTEKLAVVDAVFKMADMQRPKRMCIYKCRRYKFETTPEGQPVCVASKAESIDWSVMPETKD
jgi:hypothetical protein